MKNLTDLEYKILDSAKNGFTNAQIAEKLGISLDTVKSCLKTIYEKLNVPNRIFAAILAENS